MKKLLALTVAGVLAIAAVPSVSSAKSRVQLRHPSMKLHSSKVSAHKLSKHAKASLHKSSKSHHKASHKHSSAKARHSHKHA